MKKRIIKVIVIVTLMPFAIAMFLITIIMVPVAFCRWVVYGSKHESDTILFITSPLGLVVGLQNILYDYFQIDR